MSANNLQCDLTVVRKYLDQKLSMEQESLLESHLDRCEACRSALDDSAADASWWQEASRFLSADQWDGGPGANATTACFPGLPGTSAEAGGRDVHLSRTGLDVDQTGMIGRLSEWLDPTDDPRMLGRFGGYEIVGVIGAGGMGVVLKGHEPALNRYVAIKVLSPHLASSGAARQRFSREAMAAAAVLHENVIAIHRVEQSRGMPYLVMPYVAGVSLQRRLDQDGPLPLAAILRIGRQIAAGLAAAHAQGIVHRDIKPANILLERGVERVTLTDFGLARAVDDATMTTMGVIAGTPQYMSPEQARGESLDARSDLFSLGSVLYAMCTGRCPFRAETSYGIMRRINDSEPRPIDEINVDIPSWLVRIIGKLHAKSPEDRFQTAAEVAEILEQCLAYIQQPAGASLPDVVTRLVDHSEQVQVELAAPKRGEQIVVAVGAVALILCLAVLAVLLQVRNPVGEPRPANQSPQRSLVGDDPATDWHAFERQAAEIRDDWQQMEDRVEHDWNLPAGMKPVEPQPTEKKNVPADDSNK